MDEQVSWKGQSFTLFVFGGIVFLCSIFFVLGMLVGRGQGEKAAEAAKMTAAAKAGDSEGNITDLKPTTSPYSGITTGSPTSKDSKPSEVRDPEPEKPVAPEPEKPKPAPKAAATPPSSAPKAVPSKEKSPVPAKMYYLQVTALEKEAAAKKQVDDLRKAGFPAVVVGGGEGAKALYKVQVGPFASVADADTAKRKLESLGFKPIRKQ